MFRTWLAPIVAVAAGLFAAYHLWLTNTEPPMQPPPVQPAKSPFGQTVAGAGIVEAMTENIAIGTHVPGIVVDKFVEVGQQVDAGAILFRIDDRHVRADVDVKQSRLAAADAKLARLRSMPRPEEIPPSEARVKRMQAELLAAKDILDRGEKLFASRSVGEEELIKRRQAAAAAQEALNEALAQDSLLKKGAWESDIAVAQADVDEARGLLEQARTELRRLEVRAPIAGEVLQVNVRPGEYVGTPPNQPLIVLGNLQNLRVRIDIDESDIPDYRPGMRARAFVRGEAATEIPLRFVRIEPYVIPKKMLTGASDERVDTRVLQVIYELEETELPVYVGQQLDVFFDEDSIPSPSSTGIASNETSTSDSPTTKPTNILP